MNQLSKEEVWKDVIGYQGLYQASNIGRVKSVTRHVRQWSGGVQLKLGFLEINHKDGIKSNNSVSNLEWCNRKMNMVHAEKNNLLFHVTGDLHGKSVKKSDQHNNIIKLRKGGHTVAEISNLYACSVDTIYRVLKSQKL